MSEKVGIDRETANKVIAFLKEHSSEAIALLQKGVAKAPAGIGDKLGKVF